ncbi:MAG: hypothetical protein HWD59_00380 [Coxiellaceae bacterium]|nr:MAG: hypothetical protein HWD59_00380 [Coxiellaceae bacterium]
MDVNKIEQVQCHLLPLFSQIKESVCQYNLEIVGMKFSVPDLIRLAKEPTNLSQFPSMLFMILNCEPGKQGAPALTNILAGNIDFILQNKQQIIGLLKPLQYVSKPTYTPDTPGIFQVKRQDAPVTTPTQSNIKKQKRRLMGMPQTIIMAMPQMLASSIFSQQNLVKTDYLRSCYCGCFETSNLLLISMPCLLTGH